MMDKSIPIDLSGFLAYAKGSRNERAEGMETMKKTWKDASSIHPELKYEELAKWLGSD